MLHRFFEAQEEVETWETSSCRDAIGTGGKVKPMNKSQACTDSVIPTISSAMSSLEKVIRVKGGKNTFCLLILHEAIARVILKG